MRFVIVACVACVALMSAACAVDAEEPTPEPAAAGEAAPPEEENVGQVTSALCLHQCVKIWGTNCRVCKCESGESRFICYSSLAAQQTVAP